ncbi:MAG: hypothetical protein KCHDKBKB_01744 [Elusimicrobia bacterium]|nr:hypothetical protein [Elusimicrobiota bacterium]
MFKPGPALLFFIAGGLKAGLTLEKIMDVLDQEGGRYEKKQDGKSLEERLNQLMPGSEFTLAKTTLLITQEMGGQAVPLLEECAQILQTNKEFKDRLKSLTAQGRVSAWVVGLTPVGLLMGYACFVPEYLQVMFQSSLGWALILLSSVSIGVGLTLVQRMAQLK